jgi:two-component system sensor histidine kinase HydH
MRRTSVVLVVCVAAAVLLDSAGTAYLIRRQRAALLERFSAERRQLVQSAALRVEEQLRDVVDDLGFVGQLVQSTDSPQALEGALSAMVSSLPTYRGVVVHRVGERPLILPSPGRVGGLDAGITALMLQTATDALSHKAPRLRTSPTLERIGGGWYRVLAVAHDFHGGDRFAVGLLIDTQPMMENVHHGLPELSGDAVQILVLGPYGKPTPASSPQLAERFKDPQALGAGGRGLYQSMRRGERGASVLSAEEAAALGFELLPAVATFAPVDVEPGANWSIAVLSSTSPLAAEDHSMVTRVVLVSSAVTLGLLLISAYLVNTARQAAVLRERLRSADELARLRELSQQILDQLPTGIVALSESGRVTAINRAIAARLKSSAGADTLQALFANATPTTLARLVALVERARDEGRVISIHGEQLALLGGEEYLSVHAVPLEPHSAEARSLLVIEDLTEVRGLETQLLRAEKLATVGMLAAGIAHEIGTPLGVIRGRAEYVIGKLGPEHSQVAGLRVIIEQSDRVARTIRELLDFARVRPPQLSAVRPETVIARVRELLAFEAQRRRLRLEVEIPPGLPTVAADGDQLEQVLVNLSMNAFDACEPGGRVRLLATSSPEAERLRFDVLDDGCGIPSGDQHRVFDPFFTTKKRGHGTGLGLAIVAQIVRSHGASIELLPEPGGGTRARLEWPLHAGKVSALGASPPEANRAL